MSKKAILLTILFLNLPNIVLADIYKWTDEQGTTHISDDPTNAPPEIQEKYKKSIEQKTKKIPFKDGYIEIKETQNSFGFHYYIKNENSPTGYQPKCHFSSTLTHLFFTTIDPGTALYVVSFLYHKTRPFVPNFLR